MTIVYVNTGAQQALAQHPRAVYRVTLQRQGVASLVFASGVVTWPDVVEQVVSAAGYSPYGVPLGYARPGVQDASAVVEIRAESSEANPGSISASVGDLARVMDTASSFARVVRVERLPPVPVGGSLEERTRADTLARVQEQAADDARASSLTEQIKLGLSRVGTVGAVALGVGALVAVLWLARLARQGAPSRSIGDAATWE